jgi:hypothetical protein
MLALLSAWDSMSPTVVLDADGYLARDADPCAVFVWAVVE